MNFVKDFEKFTGLKLKDCYDEKYRECSGISYSKILNKVKKYNLHQNKFKVNIYDDYTKDATYIIFHELL